MTNRVHHIPTRPDLPHPLGRHVDHDERSKLFPFTAATPCGVDQTVLWPTSTTILDQKSLGACVGFTGADYLNTKYCAALRAKLNHGRLYGNADGINFYHLATLSDAYPGTYPPTDSGSSGLGLAKALTKLGLIDSYTHAFGFDHFRQAIAVAPVAVGTSWTDAMMRPDPDGLVHVGELTDSTIVGGHEYMVRGINFETRRVRARNHWGRGWGVHGEFDIGFDDFTALLAHQGDVTVLHPAVT